MLIAYGKGGVEDTVVPATGDNWESATGIFFHEQRVEALEAAVKQFLAWEGRFRPEVLRHNGSASAGSGSSGKLRCLLIKNGWKLIIY